MSVLRINFIILVEAATEFLHLDCLHFFLGGALFAVFFEREADAAAIALFVVRRL